MRKIGKSKPGKLYHIVNRMNGGDNVSLCGCYLPKELQCDDKDIYQLDKEHKMCEKCMQIIT